MARDVARKARDSVRRKGTFELSGLLESWQAVKYRKRGNRIIHCRGDSAGGSAKQGRVRGSKLYYLLEEKFSIHMLMEKITGRIYQQKLYQK